MTARPIGDLLRARAQEMPDRLYCTVAGRSYTFGELDAASDAVAAGLFAHGVRRGDRVALLLPNRAEMAELFFALAKLGAIQVPVNVFLKGAFLRHQLRQAQVSAIVTDAEGSEALTAVLDELPDLRLCVLTDEPLAASEPLAPVPYGQLVQTGGESPQTTLDMADTMAIMFTSGTTGLPKGCVLSHGYYQRASAAVGYGLEMTPEDVLYTSLPLFHVSAQFAALVDGLLYGIPAFIDPVFSARAFMPRAAEVGATLSFAVGAMALAILGTPAGPADRAHRLRAMFIVPMVPEAQRAFHERFGIEVWVHAYGQTECMPMTVTPLSQQADPLGSGRPAEDLELALLDDDDRPVGEGQVGEIAVRPRERFVMFDGYWDDAESTLRTFRNLWYHSGDYGRRLDSGEIAFVDRKKDALRRRGENISSMEMEAAIIRHPKIAEAAVHAVASSASEDDVKVCVVLADRVSATPQELFEFFRRELPFYAMPRYVEVLDALPRNAVGRVMKYQLRERPLSEGVWDFERLGLRVDPSQRRATS